MTPEADVKPGEYDRAAWLPGRVYNRLSEQTRENHRFELKARADLITTDVDKDGIWNACVKLGLFDA